MKWENIYVFISSTFNDMHAERDYLVKRVFPELRVWCADRKMKLMDIDLRWGVSEADAVENKRVVEVCLKNIDKCRPFFLCFLGQRRGWVPGREDINPEILREFPELAQYLGNTSVTELEILHALMHPMAEDRKAVRHARFYFRDDSYLKQIKDKRIRELFSPSQKFWSKKDRELESFKKSIRGSYPVYDYHADWNSSLISHELTNVRGADYSQGRLEHFTVEELSLKDHVLEWLKEAILDEFPEHRIEKEPLNPLELELDRQNTALFSACDAYLPRKEAEEALLSYVNGDLSAPLILSAQAGAGKTSLLAHMIQENCFDTMVFYRFAGITAESATAEKLISSLLREMEMRGLISEKELEHPADILLMLFGNILKKAAEYGRLLIVLDGTDQLEGTNQNLQWLPAVLPSGVKMILSTKADGREAFLSNMKKRGMCLYTLGLMTDTHTKHRLIKEYMGRFLKDIDEAQTECVINMEGSSNPLFLKIVLNELRMYGSFDTLMEQLRTNYGRYPRQAFIPVIRRTVEEMGAEGAGGIGTAYIVLGTMAFAREGIRLSYYEYMIRNLTDIKTAPEEGAVSDLVYSLIQRLADYLSIDGDRCSFRYESLRLAAIDLMENDKENMHQVLTGYYHCLTEKFHEQSDYVQLLYHLVRSSRTLAEDILTQVDFLLDTITHAGAGILADAFFDGASLGFPDFEELGRFFGRTAARLDVNPHTLFMEFEDGALNGNPLACKILAKKEHFHRGGYFRRCDRKQDHLLLKELLYGEEHPYIYPQDSYLVRYSFREGVIFTVNHDTMKVGRIFFLENTVPDFVENRDRADYLYRRLRKIEVRENRLYLHQCCTGYPATVDVYQLPEFELITRYTHGPTDKWSLWKIHGAGEMVYGLYCRKLADDVMDLTMELMILLENTGEEIYRQTITDMDYRFVNHYLVLMNRKTGALQIVSLRKGSVIWEHEVEKDAFLSIAEEGSFFYILIREMVCRFRIDNDTLCPLGIQNTPYRLYDTASLIDGNLFLLEQGALHVLDGSLKPLGNYELNMGYTGDSDSKSGIFKKWKNYLISYQNNKIQYFDYQRFMDTVPSYQPPEETSVGTFFIKDGYQYILSYPIRRVALDSLEETREPSIGWGGWLSFSLHNFYLDGTCIMGTNPRAGVIGMVGLKEFRRMLQFKIPDIEDKWLQKAFLYRGMIGAVLADKKGSRKTQWDVYTRLEVRFYQLKDGFPLADVWELDEEVQLLGNGGGHQEVMMLNEDGYLILGAVYIAEKEREFRAYRIRDRRCVIRCPHEGIAHLNLLNKPGLHRVFANYVNRKQQFILLDIDLDAEQARSVQINGGIIGFDIEKEPLPSDRELYIHNRQAKQVELYSLSDCRISHVIHVGEDRDYEAACRFRGKVLLLSKDGTAELYDPEKDEKCMQQLLDVAPDNVGIDEETGTLCFRHSYSRRAYWKYLE